ncbi:MAG: winged helix-turn-helix domain-containing protein [Candidatus Heimdallarchaeota archaeon]|nr:winged helix-turn-helix domain-containing protein [Candidatus Heimdallarchaeota archaeon]
MKSNEKQSQFEQIIDLLGDENTFSIILTLKIAGSKSIKQLSKILGKAESTIHHHIQKLLKLKVDEQYVIELDTEASRGTGKFYKPSEKIVDLIENIDFNLLPEGLDREEISQKFFLLFKSINLYHQIMLNLASHLIKEKYLKPDLQDDSLSLSLSFINLKDKNKKDEFKKLVKKFMSDVEILEENSDGDNDPNNVHYLHIFSAPLSQLLDAV